MEIEFTEKITDIKLWLLKNNASFNDQIAKTECYKWTRWQRDNSIHVFPCACGVRNKECISVEIYFEVLRAYKLVQKEIEFSKALEEYYQINHNIFAVYEWVNYHENLGKGASFFSSEIKVVVKSHPYTTASIFLPETEFPNLLEFNQIFKSHYYSDGYKSY